MKKVPFRPDLNAIEKVFRNLKLHAKNIRLQELQKSSEV